MYSLRDETSGKRTNRVCKRKRKHADTSHFGVMNSKTPHADWGCGHQPGMPGQVRIRHGKGDFRGGKSGYECLSNVVDGCDEFRAVVIGLCCLVIVMEEISEEKV